jgi:ribonuclease R
VGDEFEGTVTAATGFGLFVSLNDLYVEGLIHITNLPRDYYHFEAAHHRLIGERSGQVYRLGDALRVRVVRVDLDDRKVDFELVEVESSGKGGANTKGRSKKPTPKSELRARLKGDDKSAPKGKKPKSSGRGKSAKGGPGKGGAGKGGAGKGGTGKGKGDSRAKSKPAVKGKSGGKSKKPAGELKRPARKKN